MKYNININQKAFADHFPGTDVVDASIMDFIVGMCASEATGMKRIVPPIAGCRGEYTWINIKNLAKEMPLLGIKDRSAIGRRINRLSTMGLINLYIAPENTMYVRPTEKADLLVFDRETGAETTLLGLSNNRGGVDDPQHKHNINKHIYCEQESSPPISSKNKDHEQVKELFDFYLEGFHKLISKTPPVFNWGQCEKLAKPSVKKLGLDKMKELMVYYLKSDDKFYRDNAWSLSCFLSSKILHRLQQLKR